MRRTWKFELDGQLQTVSCRVNALGFADITLDDDPVDADYDELSDGARYDFSANGHDFTVRLLEDARRNQLHLYVDGEMMRTRHDPPPQARYQPQGTGKATIFERHHVHYEKRHANRVDDAGLVPDWILPYVMLVLLVPVVGVLHMGALALAIFGLLALLMLAHLPGLGNRGMRLRFAILVTGTVWFAYLTLAVRGTVACAFL